MNETILSPRQAKILNIINSSTGVSRREIEKELETIYPISKVTLTRDLLFLISKKLIKSIGEARSTKYYSYNNNPLLKPFNLADYFAQEVDKRVGQNKLNFDIFVYFKDLFNTQEINDIDKVNKKFSAATKRLEQSILEKELERFVIELSWKSSKIEGNTYSLLDTEKLIKEGVEATGHPKTESIMILNHKNVFKHILQYKNDYRELNLQLINELHAEIVKDLNVEAGIRKQAVGITGTFYSPPDNEWQIKEALGKSITVINRISFPLEKALLVSSLISYIQPFSDGNKRTGRMLANAVLMAHDFFPLSYRAVDENTYKESLIIFYEQNSLQPLKKIFIDQYLFALNTYFK